jgi:hypothetical protein
MARISSLDLFGRPHFEQLRGTETNDYAFRDHCGIVEVVLNLSVWFAIHAFFPRCAAIDCFPFRHRRSCLYRNALSWLQQEFSALPTTSSELSAHSLSIIRPKKLDNASPTSHDCSSDRAGADKCVPQAEEDYLT